MSGPVAPLGRLRLLAGSVVLVLMGLSAAYSANAWDLRDRLPPPATRLASPAAPAIADGPAIADTPVQPAGDLRSRSQPWWQPVTTASGTGEATSTAFTIDAHATQWRLAWRCTAGSLTITPLDDAGTPQRPLAQTSACPAQDTGYSVQTGRFRLDVAAAGDWQATVEQQVDVPLVEPPLAAMQAPGARVVASGQMYGIDRVGTGTVAIHQLADGSHVLRLEDFFVSINSDLEIWLSEAEHPTTTPQAAAADHERVAFLLATTGSMNFTVPEGIDLSRYRSIVIWCELTSNAYAGATLTPTP